MRDVWCLVGRVRHHLIPSPFTPHLCLSQDCVAVTSVHSGDLGWVAPKGVAGSRCAGHLVLSGRVKDTLVLSSGKNVEPQPIEDAVVASTLIKHVVLLGQVRPVRRGEGEKGGVCESSHRTKSRICMSLFEYPSSLLLHGTSHLHLT